MPITLNGTSGVVTPGATVGSITGILKASSGVVSQAVAGSDYGQLTLATAKTASGTAVDFTGIPSWVKRVTVMFNGVSTNGTSAILIQIGSGSYENTGYVSFGLTGGSSNTSTSGFIVTTSSSSNIITLCATISNINSNNWISSMVGALSNIANGISGAGNKTTSGVLDRIRITTVNGTDTFDAGTINISYE